MTEDNKGKIINLLAEAQKRKGASVNSKDKEIGHFANQKIKGNNIFQAVRDININAPTTNKIKILPSPGSIGGDALLKKGITERFNKIGDERKKRFGDRAFPVMYGKFKKDFGIDKNTPWTVIWTWPRNCSQPIIDYLDGLYANTIKGRIEGAAKRKGYVHTRPQLYKKEKEMLGHLGHDLSDVEIKKALLDYFGVDSHRELTHQQHWQWVCYLEGIVGDLEN